MAVMTGRSSDEQLLAAIAAGDGASFASFYDRHLPLVLAYLMRQTRDPELCGDLAAEVFAAVMLGAERYQPQRDTAGPWLLGIARHKLLMSLRRGRIEARARQELRMQAAPIDDSDLDRILAIADGGAESLQALVRALPAAERDAVLAHVVEERSYREIAAELRCSEMVVRKRVSRGLARLRAQLRQDDRR
jgi:RNA polymerase sigma factor (sigma-70 family)